MRSLTMLLAVACLGAPALALAQAVAPVGAATSDVAQAARTPAAVGANANANANASGTAAGLAVGQPVKDNTGLLIGQITDIKTDTDGRQVAVVQMGADAFSVETDRMAAQGGAAAINATQAQIHAMLRRR